MYFVACLDNSIISISESTDRFLKKMYVYQEISSKECGNILFQLKFI